ncbi:hypothetical protein JM949_15635 [Micromonospora sp. STR1s_6]|uniref:Uncharacterized protein n=2 Tax=Micromonospora tarensis TaxID=2806100 RepID=A0ABS1YH52_9ACTN|nr:hypothetical protein [Micromonospora tarensis]
MQRSGDSRAGGLVVTYLISDALGSPMVGVHVTCRAGNAWAELSLPQAAQLVEHLRGSLEQAAGQQGAGDE